MSSPDGKPADTIPKETEAQAAPGWRWYHKLWGVVLVVIYFELGVFLVAFPWSPYWPSNFFAWLSPEWREIWLNPYFRGAISGLGMTDIYLSFWEVFRLQRFSQPPAAPATADDGVSLQ